MGITVVGIDPLRNELAKLDRMSRAAGGYTAYVSTRLPYGWGMEYGRHQQSGKLARRAGGAHYFQRAVEQVQAGMSADIAQGLEVTGAPGPWIVRRLGKWVRRLARAYAPVGADAHAGRLSHSIRFDVGR